MRIAVLPFNAAAGARPALARQIPNFVAEMARNASGKEINSVNYMAEIDDRGVRRYALANPSEDLNETEMLTTLMRDAQLDITLDGLVRESEIGSEFVARFVTASGEIQDEQTYPFRDNDIFTSIRGLLTALLQKVGAEIPAELEDDISLFGTEEQAAFTNFLMGFDAAQYVDKAQGMVVAEFDPSLSVNALVSACEADEDWEGPYLALLNLVRLCTQYRIGNPDDFEAALNTVAALSPDDGRAYFTLGELKSAVGDHEKSAAAFEKAAEREPDEPAIYTRLAIEQMNLGMPANAERNLKKAIDREPEPKPSTGLLSQLLEQTGRAHEVPALWRERLENDNQNAEAYIRLAGHYLNSGNAAEGEKILDEALTTLEDNVGVKRQYAPYLSGKGDHDRALDFYEDCLDVAPTDPQLMFEYANALVAANRSFEAPRVLRDMLNLQIDPNLRAQVHALLVETDQPKRAEAVKIAAQSLESGQPEDALRDIKPLANWLSDYWKMWAVYSSAANQAGQHQEAETAARRLIDLFPGCEPAYVELANALSGLEREEECYSTLAVAMGMFPGSVPIGLSLALSANRLGRTDEAKNLSRQLREAVAGNPELVKVLDQIDSGSQLA